MQRPCNGMRVLSGLQTSYVGSGVADVCEAQTFSDDCGSGVSDTLTSEGWNLAKKLVCLLDYLC